MSTSVCYEKTDQDCPDDEFHDIIRSQCVADGTGINVPQGMSNGHCYSKESLKTWLSTKPQNEDFFGGKFNDADKKMIYDESNSDLRKKVDALNQEKDDLQSKVDYLEHITAINEGISTRRLNQDENQRQYLNGQIIERGRLISAITVLTGAISEMDSLDSLPSGNQRQYLNGQIIERGRLISAITMLTGAISEMDSLFSLPLGSRR